MVRTTGRAIHHTSKLVHRLLAFGTALVVVASFVLAGVAWCLAQGPIDLGGMADRVRSALVDEDGPARVSFDGLSLAWEGFQKGVDYPIDLRLSAVAITDPEGRRLVAAPRAHLTFSLAGLLLGRIVPRAIEVDGAQMTVTREADGGLSLGLGQAEADPADTQGIDLRDLREQLARPASSDHGRSGGLFDQLGRVHFRDTGVSLRDLRSGLEVRTPDLDLDLVRAGTGQVHGLLRAGLSAGAERARLTLDADWTSGSGTRIEGGLTALRPAGLGLDSLQGVDLPVSLGGTVGLDAAFKPASLRADIRLGTGAIRIGQGAFPVRSGSVALAGTPRAITVERGRFDVAHTPEGPAEVVDIGGSVVHEADRLSAVLKLALGPVNVADLPRLWPAGTGGGGRPWVVEHVTQGMAEHGSALLVVESDDALHDVVVTKATADLDVSNATFTWIDNVPPIQQASAHLHLPDADTLEIRLSGGRQHVQGGLDLTLRESQMRITGLSVKDQDASIRVQVDGPLTSTMALLKEPRLHLLSSHPIGLKVAAGDASATMDFQFPLENKLQIDDVRLHADVHLGNVHLVDIVAGHGLEGGAFDLGIDKEGLRLKGQATLAAVPVNLDGAMDFTNGAAGQVVQTITVTGQPDSAQLDAAGVRVSDVLNGPVPMSAVVTERRGGDGSIAINGDLTGAALAVGPLAWGKPAGKAAKASALLVMSHDRITRVDKIVVQGDDVALAGSADCPDGHVRTVSLDPVRLGRTLGHGTVHLAPNEPVKLVLQGEQIDLSAKLAEKAARSDAPPVTTPPWTLDAHFDRALLAQGDRADDLLVKAAGGGESIGLLDVVGTMADAAGPSGFSVKIEPKAGGRHLLVEAKDAGSFLRGIDAVRGMRAGHLTVDGTLGTALSMHPLAGTATIDGAVVKNSPLLGKLLQAITLYGMVDVLRGPGMRFSRIVLPFRYDGTDLMIDAAHAYNSSLGLTADGRIDPVSGQAALTGTIVPAYFFNSMLGNLPFVGKLFSPEKGGGVFAARFGVTGDIDEPVVSVNPVSALTPGFLREIFGVFDTATPRKGDGPDSGAR